MFIRAAAVSCLALSTLSPALAQREVQASNADPYRSTIQSQARNAADRIGQQSSTRDVLPPAERAQAQAVMRGFAQCVVRGDPASAKAVMMTTAGSAEERAIFMKMASSRARCLPKGQLRMKGNWMRGALAEQLYLQSYPAPVTTAAQPDAPLPTTATSSKDGPYHAYADCVVARNAPAADAVVRAQPGSTQEKTALGQTMPTLSSCLAGGEGEQHAVDRAMLRGYLAESLYRRRVSAG